MRSLRLVLLLPPPFPVAESGRDTVPFREGIGRLMDVRQVGDIEPISAQPGLHSAAATNPHKPHRIEDDSHKEIVSCGAVAVAGANK